MLRFRLQTLLVDADDTLWENNIYFENVINKVQTILRDFGVNAGLFREKLNETELRHIPIHGYGTANFTRSLLETFESFLPAGTDPALSDEVHNLALSIMCHPIEIIDGVKETLEYLAAHHSLFLVTKGDLEEQAAKIESSGLKRHFRGIEILSDKKVSTFRELMARYDWKPAETWMVGNSPRSDINPAIAAGMRAIYIPHPHTWILEHEEPTAHPNLVCLERFEDLRRLF